MTIRNVAVIGLGTMGAGIVEVFARHGFPVAAVDVDEAATERGRGIITKSTDRAVSKGKLSAEDQQSILERISFGTDLAAVGDADLVVEAAFENAEVKKAIFAQLDSLAPEAVLATNTSSLSVTDIAETVSDPSRVLGVHFFNPAPVQTLVEVIRTRHTSDATVEAIRPVLEQLGKHPIFIRDRAGFVVNALLISYLNRAIALYEQGFATREEMDAALVEAGNPMGPLTLADLIGNDVNLAIMERMYSESERPAHEPAPLLRRVCAEGRLGRKTGKGFYTYDGSDDTPLVETTVSRAGELPLALLAPYLNDACRMVDERYATEDDINTGMAEGCRMPKPFEQLDEIGPQRVLEALADVHAETGFESHEPSATLLAKVIGS